MRAMVSRIFTLRRRSSTLMLSSRTCPQPILQAEHRFELLEIVQFDFGQTADGVGPARVRWLPEASGKTRAAYPGQVIVLIGPRQEAQAMQTCLRRTRTRIFQEIAGGVVLRVSQITARVPAIACT